MLRSQSPFSSDQPPGADSDQGEYRSLAALRGRFKQELWEVRRDRQEPVLVALLCLRVDSQAGVDATVISC